MASAGLQMLATVLAVLGWVGDIIICALPMWKVTAFIGTNIVTAQTFWEGLWMNCVQQSTGQMQCKVYDSMLALPQDLQAARALVIISILVTFLGLFLAVAGGKCTNCIEERDAKAKVGVAAGVFFLVGGVLCLIPVCWCAHTVISDFYNPILSEAQKRELGASLFIGWGASGLQLIGGALLCCQCPKSDGRGYSVKYSAPKSAPGAYV
ncbi:claudin-like protein ZF-A89 [Carassius auratus]|uniref:Claudin n=2 Tax=cellular organisms TaxID=131567 RepID=A0A6P6IVT1_CARAU|nr:claudin-like protein ZF-A89 [Carassius auratus]